MFLSPTNIFVSVFSLFISFITIKLLIKAFSIPEPGLTKYASIDGLRGFLAFMVFQHHACIWFYYLRTDQWHAPDSNLYANYGQASVLLFFMITGFLFTNKILNEGAHINWTKLYISRILRLVPLYIFSIFLVFFIVATLSNFELKESAYSILKKILSWSAFTIFGAPDINQIHDTNKIIAGVTWSLRYEWMFYFALPLISLCITKSKLKLWTWLGALGVAALFYTAIKSNGLIYVAAFITGIISSYVVRSTHAVKIFKNKYSNYLIGIMLIIAYVMLKNIHNPFCYLLLSLVFISVCCGTDLFGVLTNKYARIMGEISYSLYLTHGIFLYMTYMFLIGSENAVNTTHLQHLFITGAVSIFVTLSSFITYKYIELPFMALNHKIKA